MSQPELVSLLLRPVSVPPAHCSAVTDFLHLADVECLDQHQSLDTSDAAASNGSESFFSTLSQRGADTRRLSRALITSSRDGSVRVWDASEDNGQSLVPCCTLYGHTEWVSSMVVLRDHRTLVTASADTQIKLWDMQSAQCTLTLSKHLDYIECLAYSSSANILASAGLNEQLYLWRLDASDNAPVECLSLSEHASEKCGSVYALSMTDNGQTLVTGGTDRIVRVWDSRTCQPWLKLLGHTDTVRSVHVSNDSSDYHCVSVSADSVVRHWDLRKQRSIASYELKSALYHNPHRFIPYHSVTPLKTSTWSMSVNDSADKVYCGGSSGAVIELDLVNGKQSTLIQRSAPIVKLAFVSDSQSLWCSTLDSGVTCWNVNNRATMKRNQSFDQYDDNDSEDDEANISDAHTTAPLLASPVTVLPGIMPLKRARAQPDGWHVLTENMIGEIQLWDVINQRLVTIYGTGQNFDALSETKNSSGKALSQWFSVDVRLGCLSLTLDRRHAFSAEKSINVVPLPDDDSDSESLSNFSDLPKINLGLSALTTALSEWLGLESIAMSVQQGQFSESELIEEHASVSVPDTDSQSLSLSALQSPRRQVSQPQPEASVPARVVEVSVGIIVSYPGKQFRVPLYLNVPIEPLPFALAPHLPFQSASQAAEARHEESLIELDRRRSLYYQTLPQWVDRAVFESMSQRPERPQDLIASNGDILTSLRQWTSTTNVDDDSLVDDHYHSHAVNDHDHVNIDVDDANGESEDPYSLDDDISSNHREESLSVSLSAYHTQPIPITIQKQSPNASQPRLLSTSASRTHSQSQSLSVHHSRRVSLNQKSHSPSRSPSSLSFFLTHHPSSLPRNGSKSELNGTLSHSPPKLELNDVSLASSTHPGASTIRKIQFQLLPHSAALPSVIQGSLLIPLTMTVLRIKQYIANKLQSRDAFHSVSDGDIEILCMDQRLDDDWSFDYVRDQVWQPHAKQTMQCFYAISAVAAINQNGESDSSSNGVETHPAEQRRIE